tara:strand:+ start:378 stop:617 length:240 start_codon:yes stop_codon:yes gene_type:complete
MAKKKREPVALTLEDMVVEMAVSSVVSGYSGDLQVEVLQTASDEVTLKIRRKDLEVSYTLPPWEWANALGLQLQRDWPS